MYGKFIDKYSYFDSNISFSLQVFVFCFYVFKRKNEAEKKSVLVHSWETFETDERSGETKLF